MVNLTKPEWASRPMRLDPYHLPHNVSFAMNAVNGISISYKIDRDGVVMKRKLNCGSPLSLALSKNKFEGIAARTLTGANCNTTFTLELHHVNPEMCLPLLVADNLDDIAADWHAWSRLMQLPMLMIDEKNMAQNVRQQLGKLMVEEPIARRKRITMVKYRPWFLRRRKIGSVMNIRKLEVAELIARR